MSAPPHTPTLRELGGRVQRLADEIEQLELAQRPQADRGSFRLIVVLLGVGLLTAIAAVLALGIENRDPPGLLWVVGIGSVAALGLMGLAQVVLAARERGEAPGRERPGGARVEGAAKRDETPEAPKGQPRSPSPKS